MSATPPSSTTLPPPPPPLATTHGIPPAYLTYMSIVTFVGPFIITFYAAIIAYYYFNSLGLDSIFKISMIVSVVLLVAVLVYSLVFDTTQNIPLPTPIIMTFSGCIAALIPAFIIVYRASGGSIAPANNNIKVNTLGGNVNANRNANRNSNSRNNATRVS